MLLACRNNLALVRCDDLESSAKILWCEIHMGSVWYALFGSGVYYCPPSTGGDYLEALSKSLSVIFQQGIGTVMLLGDFNTPGIDWDKCVPSMTPPAVSHHLCEIIQEHSLEQMMRMPTRFDAILDLVLTMQLPSLCE